MTPRDARGRRTAAVGVLAAGLVLLAAGVALLFLPAGPTADVGVVPDATAAPAASAPPTPVPPRRPTPASPRPPSRSASSRPAVPAVWAGPPHRVRVPALDIDAPVDPAGVAADGSLAVPGDPMRLGWWVGGVVPGAARGTVLIAGHVDTVDAGPGAMFRLERLAPGAVVEVDTGGGRLAYRVVGRRSYAKQALPRQLFDRRTRHRLALVTCGGEFRDGVYARNVVVYAEPVR